MIIYFPDEDPFNGFQTALQDKVPFPHRALPDTEPDPGASCLPESELFTQQTPSEAQVQKSEKSPRSGRREDRASLLCWHLSFIDIVAHVVCVVLNDAA